MYLGNIRNVDGWYANCFHRTNLNYLLWITYLQAASPSTIKALSDYETWTRLTVLAAVPSTLTRASRRISSHSLPVMLGSLEPSMVNTIQVSSVISLATFVGIQGLLLQFWSEKFGEDNSGILKTRRYEILSRTAAPRTWNSDYMTRDTRRRYPWYSLYLTMFNTTTNVRDCQSEKGVSNEGAWI